MPILTSEQFPAMQWRPTARSTAMDRAGAVRRPWPWLVTLLLTVGFFLAVHDPLASRKWEEKSAKSGVVNLAAEEGEGRASRQIGFLLVGASGAMLLIGAGARPLAPIPLLTFALAVLLVWATCSVAWSADSQVTLKRQIVLLCMLVAALGLVRRFELDLIVQIAFIHTLIILIAGIAVESILPHAAIGEEYRFAGTLHPNHAGVNAALLLLSSLFLAHTRADHRRFLLVAGAAAVALVLTKSRTAASAALAGTVVFILLAWPRRQKVLMLVVVAVGAGLLAAIVAANLLPNLTETLLLNRKSSDPTTLTGRTMIWDFAMGHVREDWGRMLTGFGYGGFWTKGMADALSRRAHFTLAEGHNAYLDVMLQLGVIGLFFYLFSVVAALTVSLSCAVRGASAAGAFAAALLVFTLVHHVAESAMTAPSFPTLILWAVIAAAALRQPLQLQSQRTI